MVDSKENYNFGLGVKGLTERRWIPPVVQVSCEGGKNKENFHLNAVSLSNLRLEHLLYLKTYKIC